MKVIKSCSALLRRLRNNEHFDFFRQIVTFIKTIEKNIPEVLVFWAALLALFIREDNIYKRSSKAIETKFINEAHRLRGEVLLMIRRTVEAALYSYVAEDKAKANVLTEVMDNYKSAVSAPLTEVSSLVYNMVEDLRKPRYVDFVKDLGLTDAVDKLEELNKEFDHIYFHREQSAESAEMQGNMESIRVQVDKAAKNFIEAVDGMYVATRLAGKSDAENAYAKIIDTFNAVIDQYERIYARRAPGHTPGKDKPSGGEDDSLLPDDPVTPVLAVTSEEVIDNNTLTMTFEDPSALFLVLYPGAGGATMVVSSDPDLDSYHNFPVTGFKMNGDAPVGLNIAPPDKDLVFDKPFNDFGACRAEIIKNDIILAELTGVLWPTTHSR
ncbi:MAG: DUF6261 family protein [Tannerellaceae bacterium]|jgi:hypothetical protein|nr:DUF6261 family protein [Tannerellaceae bacterium]